MALAAVWSPLQGGGGGVSSYGTCWTSEVACSRQDFFSSNCDLSLKNLVPMRSPPVGRAAIRSSSNPAPIDFQGRCASAQSCAFSCPVNRDTNVDRWLEESVHEIVKNIQEAPFLQYVFDSKGRLGRSHRQKISKDLLKNSDNWSKSPLRESLSKVDPDGVILVEKLEPGCPSDCCPAEAFQSGNEETEKVCPLQAEGAETNVWGVLVQTRGAHVNACYLLKTTRVASSTGICTRFCLTRAKCYGPSHLHQIESAWLL